MTLPLVGILAGPEDSTPVTPLVVALRSWCRPHAVDPNLGRPVALLATTPGAVGLGEALTGSEPVVVVADGLSRLGDDVRSLATAIVVRDRRTAAALGDSAILWPRTAIAASDHPSLSPFVRERWRQRLGLPSELIVELGTTAPTAIADTDVAATLAVCSAAIVRGPWLVTALALGTPVVTDPESAESIAATPSVHLAVGSSGQARTIAAELAADPARAAALGWGGRLLVEARHDIATVALEVAGALGVEPRDFPAAPLARLDAELEALGTPIGSTVSNRALRRAASVAGSGDWADLTGRRH